MTTTVNAANTPMVALNERVGHRRARTRLLLALACANTAQLHAPQHSQ